ncbi:MAG: CehA/McbA family metallohydrolase, partial [Blastocatellia bacterium]
MTKLMPWLLCLTLSVHAAIPSEVQVELQPFTSQIKRLLETLDYLGAPLRTADKEKIEKALNEYSATKTTAELQRVLDQYCLFDIHINPESRVKVTQGAARPELVRNGWRTFLIKVHNEAGVTAELKALSQQAERVYSPSKGSPRPAQTITERDVADRWLGLSLYNKPPMKPQLSGLNLEYRIIQLYSRDVGKREALIGFNVGQGSQDIGFRNDVDILFTSLPSTEITLRVLDELGKPTTASFLIRDNQGHVYPSQAKRLAPDFGFHPQLYRADGEKVELPAGDFVIEYTRGPEYLVKRQNVTIVAGKPRTLSFKLERWIDLKKHGWYLG